MGRTPKPGADGEYKYQGYGAGGDDYCYQGAGGCRRNIDVHKCCNGKQCSSTNMKNLRSCRYCGLVHKFGSANCKAFGKSCNKCKKMNHFPRVCRSRKNPKDIETEIESEEATDVEQTNVEEVEIDTAAGENEIFEKLGKNGYNPLVKSEILDEEVTSEGKTISKASRKRKNRKKKRINFNDADERSFEAGEQEVVIQREETSESDGARENNTGSKDSDMSEEMKLEAYGLNYEETQRKTRGMEKPCFYEGRWQDYVNMNKMQRDGYDKYELSLAEEELRYMKFLGLI